MRSCRLFGVSRQSIYQYAERTQQRHDQLKPISTWVKEIRRFMPRLGARKLYFLLEHRLRENGIKLGRDGFIAYLRTQGLLVKPVKRYTKTTFSHHRFRCHPNLLAQIKPERAEQIYVSDITYVESDEGVHYLSLVTDAYSRQIVGYHLSHDMKAENVMKAMEMAIATRLSDAPLIHHSDRGTQYCSDLYQSMLKAHDIQPSMTDGYDCYQNALAERINGILKQEFLLYKCKSFSELQLLIDQSIEIYNSMRPHSSLGLKTPKSVHKKASCLAQPAI